jgi:hypothetical protein
VLGLARPRRAAADIASIFGARADCDVNVEISRIVMNAVGVADRIVGMESLVEPSHDLLHR